LKKDILEKLSSSKEDSNLANEVVGLIENSENKVNHIKLKKNTFPILFIIFEDPT